MYHPHTVMKAIDDSINGIRHDEMYALSFPLLRPFRGRFMPMDRMPRNAMTPPIANTSIKLKLANGSRAGEMLIQAYISLGTNNAARMKGTNTTFVRKRFRR